MIEPISAAIGMLAGYALRQEVTEWLAKRRLRCEVCGSETTPEGYGADRALGDDMENWGSNR